MSLHQGSGRPFVALFPALNESAVEGVIPAGQILYHCGVDR